MNQQAHGKRDSLTAARKFKTDYPTYPSLATLRYVASIRPGGGQPSVIRPLTELLRAPRTPEDGC